MCILCYFRCYAVSLEVFSLVLLLLIWSEIMVLLDLVTWDWSVHSVFFRCDAVSLKNVILLLLGLLLECNSFTSGFILLSKSEAVILHSVFLVGGNWIGRGIYFDFTASVWACDSLLLQWFETVICILFSWLEDVTGLGLEITEDFTYSPSLQCIFSVSIQKKKSTESLIQEQDIVALIMLWVWSYPFCYTLDFVVQDSSSFFKKKIRFFRWIFSPKSFKAVVKLYCLFVFQIVPAWDFLHG